MHTHADSCRLSQTKAHTFFRARTGEYSRIQRTFPHPIFSREYWRRIAKRPHISAQNSEKQRMLAETDAQALNSMPAYWLLSKIASKTAQKRARLSNFD